MKANWLEGADCVGAEISAEFLEGQGVFNQTLPTEQAGYQPSLDSLAKDRGYIEQDEVALSPKTENLDAICAKFVDEHFHDDDEVRFVLEGRGIFDIRSADDRWMRVVVDAGDLIVVPAKRYHRFFLGQQRQIRCVRLFRDREGWVPRYRAREE